jgi:predicted nucleic acid-binding protein
VSDREAVSNASALIALVQIGRLDLLSHLFSRVVIPPEVARETAPSLAVRPAWIVTVALQRPLDPRLLAVTLDPGERETIGLAMSWPPHGSSSMSDGHGGPRKRWGYRSSAPSAS